MEPKIFFGSGPTKKDAKFACGTIAWAAIQNPKATMATAVSLETATAGGNLLPADRDISGIYIMQNTTVKGEGNGQLGKK